MSGYESDYRVEYYEISRKYVEPDPKKIKLSKEIYYDLNNLVNEIRSVKEQVHQTHSLINYITGGTVRNIRSDGDRVFGRVKNNTDSSVNYTKSSSNAAINAKITRTMLETKYMKAKYDGQYLISREVIRVEVEQLD